MTGENTPAGVSSGIYRTMPVGTIAGQPAVIQRITRNINGDVVKVEEQVNGSWQTTATYEYVDLT